MHMIGILKHYFSLFLTVHGLLIENKSLPNISRAKERIIIASRGLGGVATCAARVHSIYEFFFLCTVYTINYILQSTSNIYHNITNLIVSSQKQKYNIHLAFDT